MRPGDGVLVPPGLCGAVARLAVLGLREQLRRDGGLPAAPGLAAVLTELSSGGRAPETVVLLAPFSSREAAELAGIDPRSARRLAASGRLIARRRGRDWEIDRQSAGDYARERRDRSADRGGCEGG